MLKPACPCYPAATIRRATNSDPECTTDSYIFIPHRSWTKSPHCYRDSSKTKEWSSIYTHAARTFVGKRRKVGVSGVDPWLRQNTYAVLLTDG